MHPKRYLGGPPMLRHGLLLLIAFAGAPPLPLRAPDYAARVKDALAYIEKHAAREEHVMIPMRDGWGKPVFVETGTVYKVDIGPLVTSNAFFPGHRIRIEVSGSNFPRFERNLNTGGNNFDEARGQLARNAIHHSAQHPSRIALPVLLRK